VAFELRQTAGHFEPCQDFLVVSLPWPFQVTFALVPAQASAAYEDCSFGAAEQPVIEQACSSARSCPLAWRHLLADLDALRLPPSADDPSTGSKVVVETGPVEPGGYYQSAAVSCYQESLSDWALIHLWAAQTCHRPMDSMIAHSALAAIIVAAVAVVRPGGIVADIAPE
jgi:hypothetical protein